MAKKTKRKDRTAAALAKKKWAKLTPKERSDYARKMAETRWQKTPKKKQ